MAYRKSDLSLLVQHDPKSAARQIRQAIDFAGSRRGAATFLGISERTFDRYVRQLGLLGKVKATKAGAK